MDFLLKTVAHTTTAMKVHKNLLLHKSKCNVFTGQEHFGQGDFQ